MKKLTLSARESTIAAAKRLADESGTSVSAMFERLILFLDARRKLSKSSIGRTARQATGIITLPTGDINGREILEAALLEKYGRQQ